MFRSLDWVCPTCGVVNRTALPDNKEENGDSGVTQEMEEIVSQMAIKVNNGYVLITRNNSVFRM